MEFLRPEREPKPAFVHQPFTQTTTPLLQLPQTLPQSPLTPEGHPKSPPLTYPCRSSALNGPVGLHSKASPMGPSLSWPCRAPAEFLRDTQPHLLPWRAALHADTDPAFGKGNLVYSQWWTDRASPVPGGKRAVPTLTSQLPDSDPICFAMTSQPGNVPARSPRPEEGDPNGGRCLPCVPEMREIPNFVCIFLR